MKLIGGFNPKIPVNAFLMPVFTEDDPKPKKKTVYKTQIVTDGKISRFVNINIEKEEEDILLLKEDQQLKVQGDIPIYCYCKEEADGPGKYRLIPGNKDALEPKLLPILIDRDLNINAKIIISSFFGLTNLTSTLIDEGNQQFKEKNINIVLKKKYLLTTKKPGPSFTRNPKLIFNAASDFLKRNQNFNWESLLLFLNNKLHFTQYCFNAEEFTKIIPSEYILEIKKALEAIIISNNKGQNNSDFFLELDKSIQAIHSYLVEKEAKQMMHRSANAIETISHWKDKIKRANRKPEPIAELTNSI